MPTRNSGFLLQSPYGLNGNFEVVVPHSAGGLVHFWRNNTNGGWNRYGYFGAPDALLQPSLVLRTQQNDLHVVARLGDKLIHYEFERWPTGLTYWTRRREFGSGISGNPSLVLCRWGDQDYFHVVAPKTGGGIAHFWKNARDYNPWTQAPEIGAGLQVAAVAMIQSNFGTQGNLEAIARVGSDLLHFWSDSGAAFDTWHRSSSGAFFSGARGTPAFIQGRHGSKGNFEVVTPINGGGLKHLWRNNDDGNLPWIATQQFGPANATEIGLVQSSFGTPGRGNLEVVARTSSECFEHYWRSDSTLAWTGPTATTCVQQTLQVLSPVGFSDVDFTREGVTTGSNDQLVVRVVFSKPVNRNSVLYGQTVRLRAPNDAAPQVAPFEWSSDNRVLTIKTLRSMYDLAEPVTQDNFDDPSRWQIRLTLDGTSPSMVRPDRVYVITSNATPSEVLDGDQNGTAGGDYWTNLYWYVPG